MIKGFPPGVPGVDVYHGDDVESFHELAAAGIVFCIVKATQGSTEVDPLHAQYLARALEVGLVAGSYEFFTYTDPTVEAQHFVNNAGSLVGQIPLVIDVETYWNGVASDALANCVEIKKLTGHFPIVYASLSFWESYLKPVFPAQTTLWIADYSVDAPPIPCSFFQFSPGLTVAGVSAPLDCDVYTGTLEQLSALVMR